MNPWLTSFSDVPGNPTDQLVPGTPNYVKTEVSGSHTHQTPQKYQPQKTGGRYKNKNPVNKFLRCHT